MNEREQLREAEHESSGAKLAFALLALLVLTGVSLLMHFLPLGSAGTFVALAIAGVKVLVVALVFMELRESLAATRTVAAVTVAFLALLCLGVFSDVALR